MSRTNIKYNLFLLSLFIILSLNFVNAQEDNDNLQSPGDYRLNEDAHLFQTCDNCTFVNITRIVLANKTELNVLITMTKNATDYNFTLPARYLSFPGTYILRGNADDNGLIQSWSYSFPVNALAISQTTSQAIGSMIFLFLMCFLMFSFAAIGLRLFKSENWWVLGLFFVFFSTLLLIYNTWLGYQYHRLFTGLPDSAVPERIFWILLMIIVSGLLVSIALLFRHWRKVIRYVKKEMKRKEPSDEMLEDWDVDRWGGETWNPRQK